MAETALKFGPEWLRALSHGNSVTSPPPSPALTTKYKLADYRYGREEMLALFSKDSKMPECLKEFQFLAEEKCQLPLALLPVTEEEQRIWARSVNSDIALRVSGKGSGGPGNGISRTGRGGSVDRGRGRGRGGFFQRGVSFEDGDDGPPGSFSRPRPVERSQSASEKDQRWDDRDRRYDRTYLGRGGGVGADDSGNNVKLDGTRAPVDNWRKSDKNEDDGGWRTAGVRGVDKHGNRGSWRNHIERDRNRDEFEKNILHNHASVPNGPTKGVSHHPNQRHPSGGFWDDDPSGDGLPEWSMDEPVDTDVVGSFDSSGAFMESKAEDSFNSDEIYASDEGNVINESTESESPVKAPKSPVNKLKKSASESAMKSPRKTNILPTSKTRVIESSNSHRVGDNVVRCQDHLEKDKSTSNVILPNIFEKSSVSHSNNAVKPDVPQMIPSPIQRKCAIVTQLPLHASEVSSAAEEDAFARHKKATENMMAQWTEEEEQRITTHGVDKTTVLPPHHEDAYKWYYRDPQCEIQGPFSSSEMLEWFQSGYFTMGLMVRRGCDDTFSQLGELIKVLGNVPFMPGVSAPPIRMASITTAPTTPFTQTAVLNPPSLTPPPTHQPKPDVQLRALQQQIIQQQFLQQQMLLRQAQFQQVISQLKNQESFTSLNPQQQYEVLIRQLLAQQSVPRPGIGPIGDQPTGIESIPAVPLPLLGLTMPTLLKSDFSLWGLPPAAGPWQVGITNSGPSATGGIWDSETQAVPSESNDIEEKKRIEEEDKRKVETRKLEESKRREEEERLRQEELKRKMEEERLQLELQKREEERKRLDELKKQKEEEEKRKNEELRKIEEQKRKEEEKRKQEELRELEEKRKREEEEERRKRETQRKKEEQDRQEELRRLEELRKQEEFKRQEEMKKQLEIKRQEEIRRKDDLAKLEERREQEEIQRQKRLQREREHQELEHKKEIDAQQEKERQKELEFQKEIEKNHRLQEQKFKPQGPVWGGIQNNVLPNSSLSLTDIQRLQEEKEREERDEKLRQLQIQHQAIKIMQQSNKNGPGSWGKKSNGSNPTVLSLAEIQQEEADKIVQHIKNNKPKVVAHPSATLNSGVWGNSTSHHIGMTPAPSWNATDIANSGFWDDVVNTNTVRKSSKSNDSAFPALSSSVQPASTNSNKSKNVRAKKEEESVMRLFESHRKATDEFTTWCTDALSNLPSSLDVPTFVAFLKDIESPYEVMDYVRSYLGETKEAREFGNQFLERRSRFRNQAKQTPAEENMWGPAPAITPSVNKLPNVTANDCDGHTSSKGKPKRKRNRMQKVDNSMLGFTVQSNPDRINVGEIDHVEGM